MLVSEIMNKEVFDVNANRVGRLVEVDLNMTQGTVNHYVLRTGVMKKVLITPDKIDRIGEKILLKVPKEAVEDAQVPVK